ncbi:MAG: hypothetical protein AUJ55_00885 [Proteobacteria bacterium CG1_02_64_396]|nr:MAG: hypothetical protein AUJ55_00885 [Proteobacteria bacterium CG1_02_64_396]
MGHKRLGLNLYRNRLRGKRLGLGFIQRRRFGQRRRRRRWRRLGFRRFRLGFRLERWWLGERRRRLLHLGGHRLLDHPVDLQHGAVAVGRVGRGEPRSQQQSMQQ